MINEILNIDGMLVMYSLFCQHELIDMMICHYKFTDDLFI